MNPTILILISLSAVAVLAGVAYAVMGKGGQLARFEADHPPLDLPETRPLTPADVGRVALPLAFWGYHVRGVDEVLRRLSAALAERDERIADLERRLAQGGAPAGPRVLYPRPPAGGPAAIRPPEAGPSEPRASASHGGGAGAPQAPDPSAAPAPGRDAAPEEMAAPREDAPAGRAAHG
ncbi:DivIVA domain-containing protein [Nocardiopsis chromatogenes]|uniref:DivIVA domain-containing protein n=1 Tax=Nocardiopsis chromatogenes TaxID=280239 RepID=UPI000349D560|nr:DivIVA domain-containing protein [Nocardiopsis chromatogenes]